MKMYHFLAVCLIKIGNIKDAPFSINTIWLHSQGIMQFIFCIADAKM